MSNSLEFLNATHIVHKLKKKPDNNELLILYSYYKQATCGDNNQPEPNIFNYKNKQKWKAWNSRRGMFVHQAEVEYIKFVNQLIRKYGLVLEK
tara:strand:- start:89 stop:367 length:279 start_codon:yes stop_codon:yes gene_type:complete